MTDKGAGKEGYVRPLLPESEGRAPGRGRLAGYPPMTLRKRHLAG